MLKVCNQSFLDIIEPQNYFFSIHNIELKSISGQQVALLFNSSQDNQYFQEIAQFSN